MLELLREFDVPVRVRSLQERTTEMSVAVAFWGKDALKKLGIKKGTKARIICNLSSWACNPAVIEKLWLLKPTVQVRSHPRLHAKLYITGRHAIVGSSNASANGLTLEGDELAGWVEANALTDDPAFLKRSLALFDDLWKSKETVQVTRTRLEAAKHLWEMRPRPPLSQKSLFR